MSMVLELQTMHVRIGVSSPFFRDAFDRQQQYMEAIPAADMVCPPFMCRGVHERRALSSDPKDFWLMITEEQLLKAFVEPTRVGEFAESLVGRVIVDVTSKGGEAHTTMRKFFPTDLVPPPHISGNAKYQIAAVTFTCHFESGQDSAQLDAYGKVIGDATNTIANSLLQFPHGKAIMQSAFAKAKMQDAYSVRQKKAVKELTAVANKFPDEESVKQLGSVADQYCILFEDKHIDKDARDDVVKAAQAPLLAIQNKVQALFTNEVLPKLRDLESAMDFSNPPSLTLQQQLPWLCECLPKLDEAHRKSSGFLVPAALGNFRTIAQDFQQLLINAVHINGAIDGEYLDKQMSHACTNLGVTMHPDKFRGAFGDALNWVDLIAKYNDSHVVKEAYKFLRTNIAPIAAETLASMGQIFKQQNLNNIMPDQLKVLREMAPEKLNENIKAIDEFASASGDATLRAQAAHFGKAVALVKASADLIAFRIAATSLDDLGMNDKSIIPVSKARQALRQARLQLADVEAIFKPVPQLINFMGNALPVDPGENLNS